jgi:hypothetical protein
LNLKVDRIRRGNLSVADEVLSEDFVSHNFPAGDRETLKQAVAGFREENPGAYFPIEQLVMSDDQAFIINRMWMVPEGAPEGDMAEPVGDQMVTGNWINRSNPKSLPWLLRWRRR